LGTEYYICGCLQQPSDQQHMGTAVRTTKTSPAFWDAFVEIAFSILSRRLKRLVTEELCVRRLQTAS